MKENDYGDGVRKGKSIFYCSPLRPENSPSFAVNIKENGAPDKPCGVGRADANPKLLLNDT